jgi:RNA polymerase sigma-70 factor (ECF subfamily)
VSTAPEPPDRIAGLLQRALAGESAAESELTRSVLLPVLGAAVSKHLFGRARRRHDPRDIVQELLLHLYEDRWKRLRKYDPSQRLSSWVFAVARHWIIANIFRKRAPPEPDDAMDEPPAPDSGPEHKASQRELIQRVGEALDEEQILLFQWAHLEGLACPEIAQRLQISLEALYKRLQRMEALVKAVLSNPEGNGPRGGGGKP